MISEVASLGCGVIVVVVFLLYYAPHPLVSLFARAYPGVTFRLKKRSILCSSLSKTPKHIALTIDDSPTPLTPDILDILKKHGAKATFFIIGTHTHLHDQDGELLRRIVREGHELGNHAMCDEPSFRLASATLRHEIEEVHGIIAQVYHDLQMQLPKRWFRPGSGWAPQSLQRTVQDVGYQTVLGSIYPHDPQIRHAKLNAQHVLSKVHPGEIVILHDGRDWTVRTLDFICSRLRRNEWEVKSLGMMEEEGWQ